MRKDGCGRCMCLSLDRPECDHKITDGEFGRQLATAARKGEIDIYRFSGDRQREGQVYIPYELKFEVYGAPRKVGGN